MCAVAFHKVTRPSVACLDGNGYRSAQSRAFQLRAVHTLRLAMRTGWHPDLPQRRVIEGLVVRSRKDFLQCLVLLAHFREK